MLPIRIQLKDIIIAFVNCEHMSGILSSTVTPLIRMWNNSSTILPGNFRCLIIRAIINYEDISNIFFGLAYYFAYRLYLITGRYDCTDFHLFALFNHSDKSRNPCWSVTTGLKPSTAPALLISE